MKSKRFGFVLLPEFALLPLSCMVDTLEDANYVSERRLYDWCSLSVEGAEVTAANGLRLATGCDTRDAPPLDSVVVCSAFNAHLHRSPLRVSYGVLNLTHRKGHESPAPLVPGERFTLRMKLDHIAHAFAPGHRIRVALSTAYWPLAWPSPEVVTLGVHCGPGTLTLPRLECGSGSPALHPFEAPQCARAMNREVHRRGRSTRTVVEDVASGETRVIEIRDLGDYFISDIGLRFHEMSEIEHAIRRDDPLSACCTARREFALSRGDWQVRVDARTTLTSTKDAFQITSTCDAYESGRRVFARNWHDDIPRRLV